MKDTIKWLLFPGTNLNARLRYRMIPRFVQSPKSGEERYILDAGCGNGALAYQCLRKGNRVLGVSIKDEVERNQRFFNEMLAIPTQSLEFRDLNLYDAKRLGDNLFDEIVCTEVMEHIKDDRKVAEAFYSLLKPGGVLHLCCPNAEHFYHRKYPLDPDETGGHVRPGYTESTYRELLEPLGFTVSKAIQIGGYWRHKGNEWIRWVEAIGGVPAGVLAFFFISPISLLDNIFRTSPFSLYVKAKKSLSENH